MDFVEHTTSTISSDAVAASESQQEPLMPPIPKLLPHERLFPIQIGSELFHLSGASISSDGPSYLSRYFDGQIKSAQEKGLDIAQAIRTLYLDRDPVIFRDIAQHLQGYHIQPRDGPHFVRLYADAQFYSLPKLANQLFQESIFISIGHREFQIPRDIFNHAGNSPNFFTLGFASFFSSPEDMFPGVDRKNLIRPPAILPPSVPHRSAENFAELLSLLRGYDIEIRSEDHRAGLLSDCRYFNFRGLEQRLIPHRRTFNRMRGREEITLPLSEVKERGLSIVAGLPAAAAAATTNNTANDLPGSGLSPSLSLTPLYESPSHLASHLAMPGTASANANGVVPPEQRIPTPAPVEPSWVYYARPYTDESPAELIIEITSDAVRLHFPWVLNIVEFISPATRRRVSRLFEIIANKLKTPIRQGDTGIVNADLDDAAITLDGKPWLAHPPPPPPTLQQHTPQPPTPAQAHLPPLHTQASTDHPSAPLTTPGSSTSINTNIPTSSLPHPPQQQQRPSKRRRINPQDPKWSTFVAAHAKKPVSAWLVRNGQWRLRIQQIMDARMSPTLDCIFEAVKLDCVSSVRALNERREFLGG